MDITENPRAVIGGNNPPEPNPFEAMQIHILDLMETAQGFLDGEPIENQATADIVGKLIDEARKARNDADAMRKAEAKPFDEGKAAVQAKWTPLTDDKKGKCALIIDTAKKALVPWLEKLEADQRAEAEKARQEAEAKRQAALKAEREAASANLEAIERVELARKEADAAERAANKADKAKAHASGGGRAIGLRSYWIAELVDPVEALKHYKQAQPELLKAWLLEQANKDVHSGKRAIPGVSVKEHRRAA
ncbi:hypothetical protein TomTYG75_06810 [Sphingobium sp. TomTYG75]